MEVNQRIAKIIEHYGFNKNSFSRKIGLNNNSTIEHILGKRKTNPSYNVIHKIIMAFPELSSKWLIIGEGEMLADNNKEAPSDGVLTLEELLERKIEEFISRKIEQAIAPMFEKRDERQNILADNFHRLFMKVHDMEQWQREFLPGAKQNTSG